MNFECISTVNYLQPKLRKDEHFEVFVFAFLKLYFVMHPASDGKLRSMRNAHVFAIKPTIESNAFSSSSEPNQTVLLSPRFKMEND